jgi:RNA polymerase sigma-70 factor (ECF subfamily)
MWRNPERTRQRVDGSAFLNELPRLRRYARALVGDRASADDLVQDTLERAWSRIDQRRPDGELRAWLFGIMHNLRVDQLRHPDLRTCNIDEEIEAPVRATQTDRIEVRDLESALARLPEEQRAVLLLVAIEEMRYEDVARTLDIPVGTVMSRLSRGRERLRAMIEHHQVAAYLRVVR